MKKGKMKWILPTLVVVLGLGLTAKSLRAQMVNNVSSSRHDFETADYGLPESLIDAEIQDTIRQEYGDRLHLTMTLQQEAMTFKEYRKQLRERIIVSLMRQKTLPPKSRTHHTEANRTNEFPHAQPADAEVVCLHNEAQWPGAAEADLLGSTTLMENQTVITIPRR